MVQHKGGELAFLPAFRLLEATCREVLTVPVRRLSVVVMVVVVDIANKLPEGCCEDKEEAALLPLRDGETCKHLPGAVPAENACNKQTRPAKGEMSFKVNFNGTD